MSALCFAATPTTFVKPHLGTSVTRTPPRSPAVAQTVRAELNLIPGVPPGEDARENAPLRYYVPRPVETYENRGFATVLPRTWEGETETIGAGEIEPVTKEQLEEERIIQVDAAATGAFVDYASMMREEREQQLAELKERNALVETGRATCGESEGKEFVSNYRKVLVDGVKCVEYWGVANGPVPRLFGGETA